MWVAAMLGVEVPSFLSRQLVGSSGKDQAVARMPTTRLFIADNGSMSKEN